MSDSPVVFEKVGKTAVITLNRPQRRNALDDSIKDALAAAIKAVRQDRSVRSVVLTGAGGHFCSGADLKNKESDDDEKSFAVRDLLLDAHRWHSELMDLEKPVIAAVDGYALGAGLSLALAADFVIASERARLVSSFPRMGFVPDLTLLYILPRLVGLPRAKEIVFSARDIAADEALAMGLVQAVVPAERLRETAIEFAQRFDNAPTHVLGMAKGILNRSFETDRHALTQLEAAFQGLCAGSNYHAESLNRFLSKEAPLYPGSDRLF
ncbi:enoyl-CoA hydratase/isomerase family protein [Noviherbaspirillum saxi]|uniref:Enoyl-CoA hydratase/isomerase family protein n=1 Tax=Noviherbaspirillum saxi TaxID=2320863 RepID=A0A3A3FFL4_9BURK|nr:enoyl-CoA hydratase/isomerase family protein [Noviherbaspirillum saxi]RJF91847.1 enoyl-CoA hydratase/isomerase family protein [Noviherbaspirillum saxi]